jgi:hypothetical protein
MELVKLKIQQKCGFLVLKIATGQQSPVPFKDGNTLERRNLFEISYSMKRKKFPRFQRTKITVRLFLKEKVKSQREGLPKSLLMPIEQFITQLKGTP